MSSKGRTKAVEVRHRNPNSEELILQRKVVSVWSVVFVVPFLFGFGRRWKDWLLLNNKSYKIQGQIWKKCKEIEDLLTELDREEDFLKAEKKDVNQSTRETRGYSAPFIYYAKPEELKIKPEHWLDAPDGGWRAYLNPKKFKSLGKQGRPSVREKLGVDDSPPAATRTAYTPDDFKNFAGRLEMDGEFDHVMTFKDPQQNQGKKKRRNNNRNNNNNNNNNNRNNNNDDDDDWDDDD